MPGPFDGIRVVDFGRYIAGPFCAALLGDPTVRALGTRYVEAVTTAKIDLRTGTLLDRLGGYHYYGEAEKAHIARAERLLPIGAAEGCELVRDVPKDATLTYDDVKLPAGFAYEEAVTETQKPVAEWRTRGVKTAGGATVNDVGWIDRRRALHLGTKAKLRVFRRARDSGLRLMEARKLFLGVVSDG